MKTCILFSCLLITFFSVHSQSPFEWQKAYGSTGNDKFHGIVSTQDGNYVAMGIADSVNGDVECNIKGKHDEWIIKIDPAGNILWQTCLGGTKEEEQPHNRIIATSDGGFLTAGETWSQDYISTGNHGECDVLLVKLDSDGKVQWRRVLGGKKRDTPRYLYELPGEKYLLIARTTSNDGDIPPNTFDSYNAVVFKLDHNGKILSTNLYGGSGNDELWAVTKTMNTLVYVGHTSSPELGATDTSGWMMTTDMHGLIIDSWVYGGDKNQRFLDMIAVSSNEFIACGETGDPEDFWAVKLDLQGNLLWSHSYGGNQIEFFKSSTKVDDGVYLTGGTTSFGNGNMDCYVVKIDFSGIKTWDLTLGGSKMDWGNQMTENGYLCGYVGSDNGDITGFHGGPSDGWIVKILTPGILKSAVNSKENLSAGSDNKDIEVYQDPFSNDLRIVLNGCIATSGALDIFDLNGKHIQRLMEGSLQSGRYHLSLKNHLSPGIYFIELTTKDGVVVNKIFLQ